MPRAGITEEELEDLFRQHVDSVYRHCWFSLGELEADDVTSEVFIVAWDKIGSIPDGARRAWLLSVARGLVANRLRSRKARQDLAKQYAIQAAFQEPDPAEAIAVADDVRSALLTLRRSDREILTLVATGNLSQAELGKALNCTSKAAGVRLSRARARLDQALNQPPQGDPAPGIRPRMEAAR